MNEDDKEISKGKENTKRISEAFKAENIDQVKDVMARAFRRVAELGENDLLALAAVQADSLKDQLEVIAFPV